MPLGHAQLSVLLALSHRQARTCLQVELQVEPPCTMPVHTVAAMWDRCGSRVLQDKAKVDRQAGSLMPHLVEGEHNPRCSLCGPEDVAVTASHQEVGQRFNQHTR
eukprot:1159593-Pelagomonas_calceolata.AAC.3